jgi:hypothetical protein
VTQEKAGLGEQALNKIAEMALASQLEEAERLEVHVKTDPSKLARGEVDSITIDGDGLLMQQNLGVAELQLHINRVTVKPLSALFGKIELTHPSEGTARIVINDHNLTRAFNSESFRERLHQMQVFVEDKRVAIHAQQVKCRLLADGKLAFNSELILGKTGEAQALAFTATPSIGADGQGIVLQDVHYVEGKELPPEVTAALVAQVSEVLSLRNIELEGMTLRIQQLDVAAGKLTLQAAAYIEQFPST